MPGVRGGDYFERWLSLKTPAFLDGAVFALRCTMAVAAMASLSELTSLSDAQKEIIQSASASEPVSLILGALDKYVAESGSRNILVESQRKAKENRQRKCHMGASTRSLVPTAHFRSRITA